MSVSVQDISHCIYRSMLWSQSFLPGDICGAVWIPRWVSGEDSIPVWRLFLRLPHVERRTLSILVFSNILLVCFSGLPLLDPPACKRNISKANICKGGHEPMLTAAWHLVLREFLLALHSMDPEIAVWLKCRCDCILALREVCSSGIVTQ